MVSPGGCSVLRHMNRPIRIEKSAQAMPLTRSFRETVQARARRDVKLRQALLGEAMQMLLDGNLEEGRSRVAIVHQCHGRVRKTRRRARPIAQEPDADVRPVGQSHRRKPAGRDRPVAAGDRRSSARARGGRRRLTKAAMSNFAFLAAEFPAVHEAAAISIQLQGNPVPCPRSLISKTYIFSVPLGAAAIADNADRKVYS
jgi:hypothetical protein